MIAYLDRANVAFGKAAMSADLGFSDAVFGFGAGIFFLGYFLLEIPGALIVERWSARRWIARILLTWGSCTILVGFVRTDNQFYLARFLLGAAEAGFFPGIIVYLTHWFVRFDRARATAGFMIAAPLSLMLGAPALCSHSQAGLVGLARVALDVCAGGIARHPFWLLDALVANRPPARCSLVGPRGAKVD
jgi:MFS family permease